MILSLANGANPCGYKTLNLKQNDFFYKLISLKY